MSDSDNMLDELDKTSSTFTNEAELNSVNDNSTPPSSPSRKPPDVTKSPFNEHRGIRGGLSKVMADEVILKTMLDERTIRELQQQLTDLRNANETLSTENAKLQTRLTSQQECKISSPLHPSVVEDLNKQKENQSITKKKELEDIIEEQAAEIANLKKLLSEHNDTGNCKSGSESDLTLEPEPEPESEAGPGPEKELGPETELAENLTDEQIKKKMYEEAQRMKDELKRIENKPRRTRPQSFVKKRL